MNPFKVKKISNLEQGGGNKKGLDVKEWLKFGFGLPDKIALTKLAGLRIIDFFCYPLLASSKLVARASLVC